MKKMNEWQDNLIIPSSGLTVFKSADLCLELVLLLRGVFGRAFHST